MNSLSKQRTLAMMTGFERYTKKTRRAMFLEEMEQVVPWAKLCALIEPHYPKPGNGRRPKELEQMLRIYFLQQWFNLSDPAVEEALYDSATLRQFVGIDLGSEPVPDESGSPRFDNLFGNRLSANRLHALRLQHSAKNSNQKFDHDMRIAEHILHRVAGGVRRINRDCADRERELILEHTFADDELTAPLRIAPIARKAPIHSLTLDDLGN
jgi:hypothetical protein